jgi:hypothetical protein
MHPSSLLSSQSDVTSVADSDNAIEPQKDDTRGWITIFGMISAFEGRESEQLFI